MKDSQFEPSLDGFSPSWSYQHGDWNSPDIELEAKMISQSSIFVLDHEQKMALRESCVWERPSPGSQVVRTQSSKPSQEQSNHSDQCCAFQKLDNALGYSMDNKNNNSRKGPCQRLIAWILLCRDNDPNLDDYVKRSCPLARCTFSCDPDNGDLIKHILSCSFLKYGIYRCPYHNKAEAFTMPCQRRPRKRWNRTHSLRDAFRDICRLGSKGIHKAFGHSNKRQRCDTQDDHSTDNESVAFEIDSEAQVVRKRPVNDRMTWSEKRMSPARRSEALQSRIQSQVREADDSNIVSELASDAYCELPGEEIFNELNELSAYRFSAVPQDLPRIVTAFDNLDTDSFLPSPLSTTHYVSSERFESPISPQDVQPVIQWAEAMKSSSGQHASLDAMVFGWPMNQKQDLQPTPLVSASRSVTERRRAKGMQNLCIDTSVGGARPVAQPKSNSPTSLSEQLPSSPDNPEVLSYEPIKVFEELRSTFQNTYTLTYAQLSRPPRPLVNQEIIDMQSSPAKVFFSGWDAVEMVLNGKLPQKFWWLFSLAQLAFTCGQVVWEGKLKYQIDDIVDDLKVWSHALRSPRERQHYQEVIEQIFASEDRRSSSDNEMYGNTTASLSPISASTFSYRDALSLDGRELLAKLRDGVVIRLCLQFLSTFEFLQNRTERINNVSMNGLASLLQTAHSNDDNVAVLDSVVIRPLLAMKQFVDLGPVIEKASDLLYEYPSTTSRELEVFLVCHARYYTRDHTLHLQFRRAVADACAEASLQLTGTIPEPAHYLLEDIVAIRQCQKDLAPSQDLNQNHPPLSYDNTNTIQELQGSPVEFSLHNFTYTTTTTTTQDHTSCVYPRSRPGRRHLYSHIQTPTSANTASPTTAASSQAPSIWTPISAHSISPATATEPNFQSPLNSMYWPTAPSIAEETSYMHPNFPLPADNDYTLLANEFISSDILSSDILSPDIISQDIISQDVISQDISLFTTDIPTTAELPAGPEAKASLSCPKCSTVFTGKEQFLSSNLRRHMRELHSSAAKGLTCRICQKAFTRKHNLKVHMNSVHAEGRS